MAGITANTNVAYATQYIKDFTQEFVHLANLNKIVLEIKTLVLDSKWMVPVLFFLLLVEMDMFVMLASWIFVILKTRIINKKEQAAYKMYSQPVYKLATFWVNAAALIISFLIAKLGVEIVHFITWCTDDPQNPNPAGVSLFLKLIIKWLAFLQYFTFYRVYLNVFMAFGTYINPLIQKMGLQSPTSNPEEAAEEVGKEHAE